MTSNSEALAILQAEQKSLEEEIRIRRTRLSEIRVLLDGTKEQSGLVIKVQIETNKAKWIADEPIRAAMRATPEYQEWEEKFMLKMNIVKE